MTMTGPAPTTAPTTTTPAAPSPWVPVIAVVSTVSAVASTYHGYKRNNSVGWALVWGFLGALFPIITPTVAIAEGFGKPKRKSNPGRRRRR